MAQPEYDLAQGSSYQDDFRPSISSAHSARSDLRRNCYRRCWRQIIVRRLPRAICCRPGRAVIARPSAQNLGGSPPPNAGTSIAAGLGPSVIRSPKRSLVRRIWLFLALSVYGEIGFLLNCLHIPSSELTYTSWGQTMNLDNLLRPAAVLRGSS
jgi:hypothetical protein